MTLSSPIVTSPFSINYSTNVIDQTIAGTAPVGTVQVYVNGSAFGVEFSLTTLEWSYAAPPLDDGENLFEIIGFDGVSFSSPPTELVVTYLPAESSANTFTSPTGIFTRSYKDAIEVVVEQPLNSVAGELPVGYNFYYSTTSGLGFQKLNALPIREPAEIIRNIIEETVEVLPTTSVESFEVLEGEFTVEKKITTQTFQEIGRFVYSHDLNSQIPVEITVPAYYYITSLYTDEISGVEIESAPSQELVAKTLVINTTLKGLPERSRADVVKDYIDFAFDTNPLLDLAPNSITRDIYIEPFANEVEKLRFLIDFHSRAQSFVSLVALDDADGDRVSDPIEESVYKQNLKIALGVEDDFEVQRVIDEAFEKLSSNVGVNRLVASQSKGVVTLRTTAVRGDIYVDRQAVFSTAEDPLVSVDDPIFFFSDVSISVLADQAASFYNPASGFFEINVPVTSTVAGSFANVNPGQITVIVSGVSGTGLEAINLDESRYGQDQESNISLAERSLLAIVGVDSGSKGGYLFDALKVPGVSNVNVVSSGDPLMIRDLITVGNPTTKHVWGTVDVYIQSAGTSTLTESFAYGNAIRQDELFDVASTVFFQICTSNTAVSFDSPIFSVTRVVNNTRGGAEYDLTGVEIIGGTTIDLDELNATNIAIGICSTDNIRVDYSYRQVTRFVFTKQPVNEVISIVGEVSGDLSANYNLIRASHPLVNGRSTRAGDFIEVFFNDDKPLGAFLTTVDTIVLLEEFPVAIAKHGALVETLTVTNSDATVTYVEGVDYELLTPSDIEPRFRIARISTGSIPNSDTVVVTYQHGENITVSYSYYSVPNTVLESFEDKHIDADVIVKRVVENEVVIDATVVLKPDEDTVAVDTLIRLNLLKFFADLKMGGAVHQSDIIAIIDDTTGVDYVLTPLTKLNRADDSLISDEQLPEVEWEVFATDQFTSFITSDPVLAYKTLDMGGKTKQILDGPGEELRIVGVRDANRLYPQVDSESDVSRGLNRSYIREDGKVIVSTFNDKTPEGRPIHAIYYVYGEEGTRSIFSATNELLVMGEVNLKMISVSNS
jgi:hypothetical protein